MIKNQRYGNDIVQEIATDHLEIIQRLKEGVAVLRNGRFAFANPAFVGVTGCRPEALIGKELPEPFPGVEQAAILRDHEDVLRSGNNSRPHELWIETPAGRARIEMTMAPLQISAALDGMEEELSEMDERFMTSARPEEKDEIWTSGREAVNGYVRDVNFAYRKSANSRGPSIPRSSPTGRNHTWTRRSSTSSAPAARTESAQEPSLRIAQRSAGKGHGSNLGTR